MSVIVFDARPERGGGVWQSDGVGRNPVRTGDTWPALEAAGAKRIGVAPNGLFDDLIDIEAALAARIWSPATAARSTTASWPRRWPTSCTAGWAAESNKGVPGASHRSGTG